MTNSRPTGTSFWLVLLAVFIGFCTFYAPQPLLPAFKQVYNLTPTHSAWLLTMPFLALAIGPIVVGALLQFASVRLLLGISMLLLGTNLLLFALATDFKWLMVFRLLQSILLPIIFTVGVTYASQAGDTQYRQRRVALYLTTSIIGGFAGRLISGFVAASFGLSAPFALFGTMAIFSSLSIAFYVNDVPLQAQRVSLTSMRNVLNGKPIRFGLLLIFTTFFTYSGVLIALPFRLVELDPGISPDAISIVYLGYAIGILIPLILDKLVSTGFGEHKALTIGISLLCIGLVGLSLSNRFAIMFFFLILSSGMFALHATTVGWLNKIRPNHASVINGAYISSYYSAAAVASVVPLLLIQWLGWHTYLVSQLLLALTAFWHSRQLAQTIKAEASTA